MLQSAFMQSPAILVNGLGCSGKSMAVALPARPAYKCHRINTPLRQAPMLFCRAQSASVSAQAGGHSRHQQQQLDSRVLVFRMAAAVASVWQSMVRRVQHKIQETAEKAKEIDLQTAVDGLRRTRRGFRVYSMVAPFAAVTSTADTFLLVSKAVGSFVKLYLLLLFIRVLLSWFPTFKWDNQPWLALRQVTDPYLGLFRGLVPPLMGTIDFTPLLGFLILQFLAAALNLDDGDDDW